MVPTPLAKMRAFALASPDCTVQAEPNGGIDVANRTQLRLITRPRNQREFTRRHISKEKVGVGLATGE